MSQETVDSLFKLCIDTEAMINAVKTHAETKIEAEKAQSDAKIQAIKDQSEATIKVLKEHSEAAIKAVKDYIVASNSIDSNGSTTTADKIKTESNNAKEASSNLVQRRTRGMRIVIKDMTGRSTYFQVEGKTTVKQLKEKIEELWGIPVKQQRLVSEAHLLANLDSTMDECGVHAGTLMHLIIRLCGC